ncbi:hypothetical protein JTB14_022184 [Gonioctena quinquepunctata]|nr:hypothetical protein JTB14_022184 [Gonioctena quinquepunctata]
MENDYIKSLNKIKSTINENDQIVLACQASTQSYNKAMEKLKYESERLTKDIVRIDGQIEEFKPQVAILEKCVEVQNETFKLTQESILTHRLYNKYLEENLKEHKKKVETMTEEYSLHYQQCREKLEQNPAYQYLLQKRIELKKCKIDCLMLQQKIIQRKKINKQKIDIRRKLFYANIISFAEAWLKRRDMLAVMKEYEEVKEKEKQCMIKYLEMKEKMKQKISFSRKETEVPQIEFSENRKNEIPITGQLHKNEPKPSDKRISNPFYEIKDLLEENNFTPPESVKVSDSYTGSKNDFSKAMFNPTYSKVRILKNKTIKLPDESKISLETTSKEETSKAIDAKLQKVIQNFNRSLYKQNNNKSPKRNKGKLQNSQKSICSQEEKSNKIEINENSQQGTGASQELENLNISQDENNPLLNLVSQESTGNSQSKLKKFKYAPEENLPFLSKTVTDKNGFQPSALKSTLHMNKGGGPKSPPKVLNKENLQKAANPEFKKDETNSFIRNSPFSMSSGKNTFGGPFTKEKSKNFSNTSNFSASTVTNKFLKANSNSSFPQTSKNDNNVNNIFKKPEASGVVANHEKNISITGENIANSEEKATEHNVSIDENNFFSMGGQYNFGNIKQFSQNPNESGDDYDVAWSPPVTDFAETSPVENQSLFSFGQSNAAFGF